MRGDWDVSIRRACRVFLLDTATFRDGGSKGWIFRYRIGTKQRSIALGSASGIPLSAARDIAWKHHADVKQGKDPSAAIDAAKQAATDTFGAAIEKFIKARSRDWRPSTQYQMENRLRNCAKKLHSLPVTAITQNDIAGLLTDLEEERGPVACNRTRTTLSGFFSWYRSEGNDLPRGNPVDDTRVRKEKSDDAEARILNGDEIKRIWNAAGDDAYGGVIKLLMLTGCRRDEISDLAYSEITDSTIELPATRVKNRRSHSIPISTAIRSVLDKFPPCPNRPFLFGITKGFTDHSASKRKLDARMGDIPHWTLHSFRKTLSTGLHEMDVPPHIVEAVINHVSGHKAGVAGVYNVAKYEPQKRAALELWGEHVMALVEGRKGELVPFKQPA
jgi:integrase